MNSQINNNNNNITKKSERIFNKNNKLYKNICKMISDKLISNNDNISIKNKLYNVIDIYNIILINFNLLFTDKMNSKSYVFYSIIINKANELLNEEKTYKLKTLYKELSNIISKIESKYIDYMCINTKKNDLLDTETECPICMETIQKQNFVKTECGHFYHKKCIYKHLLIMNSCPICRKLIMDK